MTHLRWGSTICYESEVLPALAVPRRRNLCCRRHVRIIASRSQRHRLTCLACNWICNRDCLVAWIPNFACDLVGRVCGGPDYGRIRRDGKCNGFGEYIGGGRCRLLAAPFHRIPESFL